MGGSGRGSSPAGAHAVQPGWTSRAEESPPSPSFHFLTLLCRVLGTEFKINKSSPQKLKWNLQTYTFDWKLNNVNSATAHQWGSVLFAFVCFTTICRIVTMKTVQWLKIWGHLKTTLWFNSKQILVRSFKNKGRLKIHEIKLPKSAEIKNYSFKTMNRYFWSYKAWNRFPFSFANNWKGRHGVHPHIFFKSHFYPESNLTLRR